MKDLHFKLIEQVKNYIIYNILNASVIHLSIDEMHDSWSKANKTNQNESVNLYMNCIHTKYDN